MLVLKKFMSKKAAFTLIEIIIVITIVAFLSAAIYSGYSRLSGTYNLALATDDFGSKLSELKNKALYSGDNFCYGFMIEKSALKVVKAKFLNPVEKCTGDYEETEQLTGEDLILADVKLNGQRFDSKVITYYLPLTADTFLVGGSDLAANSVFEFKLKVRGNDRGEKVLYFLPALAQLTDTNPL